MANSRSNHRGETARHHRVTRVPTAGLTESAAVARARLTGATWHYVGTLYVLDAQGRLDGLVPITALLAAPPQTSIAALRPPLPPAVHLQTDQEHVVYCFPGSLRARDVTLRMAAGPWPP